MKEHCCNIEEVVLLHLAYAQLKQTFNYLSTLIHRAEHLTSFLPQIVSFEEYLGLKYKDDTTQLKARIWKNSDKHNFVKQNTILLLVISLI